MSLIAQFQRSRNNKYTNTIQNIISGQLPGAVCLVASKIFTVYRNVNKNDRYDNMSNLLDNGVNAVEDIIEIKDFSGLPSIWANFIYQFHQAYEEMRDTSSTSGKFVFRSESEVIK